MSLEARGSLGSVGCRVGTVMSTAADAVWFFTWLHCCHSHAVVFPLPSHVWGRLQCCGANPTVPVSMSGRKSELGLRDFREHCGPIPPLLSQYVPANQTTHRLRLSGIFGFVGRMNRSDTLKTSRKTF